MKLVIIFIASLTTLVSCSTHSTNDRKPCPEKVQVILDNTSALKYGTGDRLPLYLWPAIDPGDFDNGGAEKLVAEYAGRGIAVISSWDIEDSSKLTSGCLPIARAQKKLKQKVNINASDLMYSFFNGDESTAHIDELGKPFFDNSFGNKKMGCPFALETRKNEIRQRFEKFVGIYKKEGLPIDFIFTDWEVDGPLEVNNAYEASKRCTTCRKYLGENFTFTEFQKQLREMRSYLENNVFSEPVLANYPEALIGNYAVYPNDGYRYWYDYFEYYVEGQPYKKEQNAKYRKWYNDFPLTGFTYAMPVVYPWSGIYNWYNFENTDYRWFYNMLLNASNAGKSTPQSIPVVSFVHWHTIFEGNAQDTSVNQLTKECYQELLWHMLLRGTDAFFLWAEKEEYPEEVKLLHEVYADAQKYGRFLDHGMPITYDVPGKPGAVISGLIHGDSVLIRRTDFGPDHGPVTIFAGIKPLTIEYSPGTCTIIPVR